jgi:hypothetical protein
VGQRTRAGRHWLSGILEPEQPYYFDTESLLSPAPRAPRQPSQRERATMQACIQAAIDQTEAALDIAHSEDPSDWQQRIAEAMEGRNSARRFSALLRDTELSPGALLLGLLFGGWGLEQRDFYGELEVRYE